MTSLINVGPEILVPTTTDSYQTEPSVATLSDGSYVVAWSGVGVDGMEIFSQHYDATGHRIGGETRVNTTTAGGQLGASVTALTDGGYMVTWATPDSYGYYDVAGQRFDHDGHAVGGQIVVSAGSYNDIGGQGTALANGGFAFVVQSGFSATDDDIRLSIYNPNGSLFTVSYPVSSNDSEKYSSIAALSNGNMVVTYFVGTNFYAQIMSPGGARIGSPITLSTTASALASIASLPEGGFVATWTYVGAADKDIAVQTFDNAGVATSDMATANTMTTGGHYHPVVTVLDDGGYVVVWVSSLQDGSSTGIYAQRFDAEHAAIGDEFQVNTYTTGVQEYPEVSALADGGFVVTWSSDGEDGSGTGVYQRVYSNAPSTTGSQTLWGTHDADILDGGAGNDIMYGGFGDDIYVVGSAGDVVHEVAGQGLDTDPEPTSPIATLG